MSNFKSPNQRKFLFALDAKKKKDSTAPLVPNPVQHLIQPSNIGEKLPGENKELKLTTIPSLPALEKIPKFGKIRKYFKK